MSEPFLAEIRIFAGNFAPRGWALCDGQLMPINQNQALFSILGTTYGGDGRTNFAVPNLQGRAPMQAGRARGLTERRLGERGGVETVTLSHATMPSHTHTVNAATRAGDQNAPESTRSLAQSSGGAAYQGDTASNLVSLASQAIPHNAGGSKAHDNMQPFLVMNFIIALDGLYPQRA